MLYIKENKKKYNIIIILNIFYIKNYKKILKVLLNY